MKYLKSFVDKEAMNAYNSKYMYNPSLYLYKNPPTIYKGIYKQIDYISSTPSGSQYIDLGCKIMETTENIKLDIKFKINDAAQSQVINIHGNTEATLFNSGLENSSNTDYPGFFIRRTQGTGRGYAHGVYLGAKWEFTNSTYSSGTNRYMANNLAGFTGVGDGETRSWILYEKSFLLDNIPSEQCHDQQVTLFSSYSQTTGEYFRFVLADLYYVKIVKGNIVIRDLIPVVRITDNTPGMFDKEYNVFYPSQGDEPFVAGIITQ